MQKKTDEKLFDIFANLDKISPSLKKPSKKIAIIATPRSGSNYFCDALSQSNLIGNPQEWANSRYISAYAKYFNKPQVNFKEYIDFVTQRTIGEGNTFSIKILVEQYMHFKNTQKFDLLSLGFDTVIYVRRLDKIAQAYSYTKASLTDQWRYDIKAKSALDAPEIKDVEISKRLHLLHVYEEYFNTHLKQKINHSYTYEEFTSQKDFFTSVFKDLNIDVSDDYKFNPSLIKQQNEKDLARIELFRKSLNL